MPAMAPPDMTLWVRDNPITDVKTTFSSWDNCMSKAYCKWPAIIAIVIASLILISVISCLVRCLCCGLECCCGCFRCFNACCDCCTPRRSRRDKYRDVDDGPGFGGHNPYGGYQPPPAAPTYIIQQSAPPQPQRFEPSRQYASFETAPKQSMARSVAPSTVHEDSLPSMPVWNDAQKTHAHYEEEVEMDHLNHQQAQTAGMLAHQAPDPVNRSGPTPGAQTEGMGLYNDAPTHHADGDLGYGGAAASAVHPAYRDQHSGYVSPPAHDPYNAPQGAANSYYQHTASPPPPSYQSAPSHGGYQHDPISPTSAAAGLPAALTPGGGIQPAHQAHGQDSGVTGGSYDAYQGGQHGYRDV